MKRAVNNRIENNQLDEDDPGESVKEIEEATGVDAPDPEHRPDPWDKKPSLNIYYDETEESN